MACLFVVAMERELKLEFSEHLTEILFILFKDFHLFVRESTCTARGSSGQREKQAPHRAKSPTRGSTPGPWDRA